MTEDIIIERITALHPKPGDLIILRVDGSDEQLQSVARFGVQLHHQFGAMFVAAPAWVSVAYIADHTAEFEREKA